MLNPWRYRYETNLLQNMKNLVIMASLSLLLAGCASGPLVSPLAQPSYRQEANAEIMAANRKGKMALDARDELDRVDSTPHYSLTQTELEKARALLQTINRFAAKSIQHGSSFVLSDPVTTNPYPPLLLDEQTGRVTVQFAPGVSCQFLLKHVRAGEVSKKPFSEGWSLLRVGMDPYDVHQDLHVGGAGWLHSDYSNGHTVTERFGAAVLKYYNGGLQEWSPFLSKEPVKYPGFSVSISAREDLAIIREDSHLGTNWAESISVATSTIENASQLQKAFSELIEIYASK